METNAGEENQYLRASDWTGTDSSRTWVCVTRAHVFSLLLAPAPEVSCHSKSWPKGAGRKEQLQSTSKLCFGVKDETRLFTDQYMALIKENSVHSLMSQLKFSLSPWSWSVCGEIKTTYLKVAIIMHELLSREASEAGTQVLVPE